MSVFRIAFAFNTIVAALSPGGEFFIAPDQLGAPHQIADAGATAVWLWDHDPFGNGLPSGTFSYHLRFPGQFYDHNAKLHYNYFRDYDPNTGRYIESDLVGLLGASIAISMQTVCMRAEIRSTRLISLGLKE